MNQKTQVNLNLDPALPERFGTLREYVSFLAYSQHRPLKSIAADMDICPSTLTRKLNQSSKSDTQRFNLDDLEQFFASAPEAAEQVLQYIAAKYLESDENRRLRLEARAEHLMRELAQVLPSLREGA